MAATVGGYFSHASTTTWSGIRGDVGQEWLLVVHAVPGGLLADMGSADPGDGWDWPRGSWQLLTEVDAGDGLPKLRVWAVRFVDTVERSISLPCTTGVNNHSHLYFVGGQRPFDKAERVFSVGAVTSTAAAASQAAPLYAPDDSGLLIGAWLSGGLVNYTSLDSLTMRAEVDGTASTSRSGEMTISAHGPDALTATASAAQKWAAVSIAVRDATGSVSFPVTPLGARTELALGASPDADPATWAGLWTDITDDVNLGKSAVTISRGRGDETSTAPAATMQLALDNASGKYVRLNPLSPYYGLLSKNTPIRQWVDYGAGMDVRYTGQVSEWPPRSRGSQIDEHMPITAAGITRRLSQGQALRSPIARRVARDAATVAYWPLESDTSSGLVGGSTMRVAGELAFSGDGPAGSAGALSTGDTGKAYGVVPGMEDTGAWSVSWWVNIPSDFNVSTDQSATVSWTTPSGDPAKHNTWGAHLVPGTSGGMAVGAQDDAGSETVVVSPVDLRGRGWVLVTAMASITGGTDTLLMLQLGIPGVAIATATLSGELPTPISAVAVNGRLPSTAPIKGQLCHIVVRPEPQQTGSSLHSALLDAGEGYAGERAANRIRRLAGETGVPVTVVGDDGTSEPLGPQPTAPLLDVLRDCEAADGGVLYEARDGRLTYQPRNARYNATAVLACDYAAEDLAPPFEPTDDDQKSRNDWTISRPSGGSARVTDPASIAEIGLYDDSASINVAADSQLPDQAGWRVHLGTNDDLRYPAVSPNLLGRSTALLPDWTSLDIGSAAQIINPGRDLQPGDIDLFVEGYTETISAVEWRATMNCSPGRPWVVGVLDDDVLGRTDTDGSQLAAAIGASDTSLSVATVGHLGEDFEDASLNVTITNGGNLPWARSNTTAHAGTWSLKSGAIGNGQTSDAIITVPDGATLLRFWYRVSSEPSFDFLRVLVDDVQHLAFSGDSGWVAASITVAGASSVTFRYAKDAATASFLDSAFIDDLQFQSGPLWTTDAADCPFDITVGGEAMTVTSVSGSASPQTFIVTRHVNSIVKAHSAGEDVRLHQPTILSS